MLKKVIKYTDYNGNPCEDTFYFNLSKAELAEKEIVSKDGYAADLQRIVNSSNNREIFDIFKGFIRESYGKKSDDGKRFIKSPEIWAEFEQSEAYSALLMELVTDEVAMITFINGIIPQDLVEQAAKMTSETVELPDEPTEKQLVESDLAEYEAWKASRGAN